MVSEATSTAPPQETVKRKFLLAFLLACPPCLASGLVAMGASLGLASAVKEWLGLGFVAVLALGLAVWIRRRRSCPV